MANANLLIAVVDDELSVRTMLGRVLRLADYNVSTFPTGEDFLASIASQRPACAILDVHMPGLSGFEVGSRMRAASLPIPIVFITASDDAALDRQAHAVGGIGPLRKPFSSAELLAALQLALLGQRAAT